MNTNTNYPEYFAAVAAALDMPGLTPAFTPFDDLDGDRAQRGAIRLYNADGIEAAAIWCNPPTYGETGCEYSIGPTKGRSDWSDVCYQMQRADLTRRMTASPTRPPAAVAREIAHKLSPAIAAYIAATTKRDTDAANTLANRDAAEKLIARVMPNAKPSRYDRIRRSYQDSQAWELNECAISALASSEGASIVVYIDMRADDPKTEHVLRAIAAALA